MSYFESSQFSSRHRASRISKAPATLRWDLEGGNAATEAGFKADCSQCAALCCVAFAFERNESFAIDKAAGEPCPHIGNCGQCVIYGTRFRQGFAGCTKFECFGAGQRVIQNMFDGRSWQAEPELLGPMIAAFAPMKKACELLFAVAYAKQRKLRAALRDPLNQLELDLNDVIADVTTDSVPEQLFRLEMQLRGIFLAIERGQSDGE